MRKNIFGTIFIAAALAIAAISCQKSMDELGPTAGNDGTIEIKVNAAMGQYSPAETTKAERIAVTRVSWKGGETVYVYDGKQCLGSLKAALAGTEDRYALLSTDATHTVAKPAGGTTKLTLLYSPLFTEAPAVSEGAISVSLEKQMDATPPFVIYATLDFDGAETVSIINTVVPFKLATSLITVNCTGLEPGKAIKYAKLGNVNTVCKLTLSGTDAPAISGDVNGTIFRAGNERFTAENVNSDGCAMFQIATPLLEAASEARVLTVTQGAIDFTDQNFSKKSLSAATAVNTFSHIGKKSTRLIGVFSVSGTKKVYFSPSNLTYNVTTKNWSFYDHPYDRAANGPASTSLISLFTWGYGTWSTSPDGDEHEKNKFTDWGSQIVDGNTWRTLTIDEWRYLFNFGAYSNDIRKDKYIWATVHGVGGYVIAPDNFEGTLLNTYADEYALEEYNLAFLPAAGYRYCSSVFVGNDSGWGDPFVSDKGHYWSSSAGIDTGAYAVIFDKAAVGPDYDVYRDHASSVRLVAEVK